MLILIPHSGLGEFQKLTEKNDLGGNSVHTFHVIDHIYKTLIRRT